MTPSHLAAVKSEWSLISVPGMSSAGQFCCCYNSPASVFPALDLHALAGNTRNQGRGVGGGSGTWTQTGMCMWDCKWAGTANGCEWGQGSREEGSAEVP